MTEPQQTFDAALADFVAEVNRVSNKNQERFTRLPQGGSVVVLSGGAKYTRLVHSNGDSSRSCYGFIRNSDGAVLYAAGWKGPYKGKTEASTVRGNIYDATTWERCIGPYGIRTIR